LWGAYAVRDGNLITGQNPASSALVAQHTLAALQGK
jgi:putative intracellular protease/amidase